MDLRIAALAALGFLATQLPPVAAQGESCPLDFTATPNGLGTVTFHWSGFGGADGYQVIGNAGQGNSAAYTPMLGGDARAFTRPFLDAGPHTFWVVAFHSGTVAASSCHRDVIVASDDGPGPPTQIAFFPTPSATFIAFVAGISIAVFLLSRL